MRAPIAGSCLVCAVVSLLSAAPAGAQPLGTFRWRTEPFCNVITVTVTQLNAVYVMDGFDEPCGGSPRQPVRGVAVPQANGSITMGFAVVTVPGGAPVNIEAGISPATFGGTWRDNAGNTGTLTFGPTSVSGGPRPLPAAAPAQLPGAFVLQPQGGFAAVGDPNAANAIPVSGAGRRMMWHAGKAAWRVGEAVGSEWDDPNVGVWSAAIGHNNIASGTASFAAGANAFAQGTSSVAIGFNVAAVGTGSLALGSNARSETGAFTFADRSVSAVIASGANQFNARAVGGVGFYTNTTLTAGVELKTGASAWSSVSDANMKEHFRDLDGDGILAKLAAMPIREWNYKAQDAAIRHVGPTAQDFAAAFGLGEDPLRISTIDADGIALRAIQALEARTTRLSANDAASGEALATLQSEVRVLRAELEALRDALTAITPKR